MQLLLHFYLYFDSPLFFFFILNFIFNFNFTLIFFSFVFGVCLIYSNSGCIIYFRKYMRKVTKWLKKN